MAYFAHHFYTQQNMVVMLTMDNGAFNSLLCFLSTSLQTNAEQPLASLCLSFYNSDGITVAKKLLFGIASESLITRRERWQVKI